MPITRTPMIDDDGSGTTGTIINNAWKQELYGQIDGLVGSWQDVPFNAANFSALAPMTWTVGAAAIQRNRYTVIGKTLFWSFYLSWFSGASVLGGSPSGTIYMTVPGGLAAVGNQVQLISYVNGIVGVPLLAGLYGTSEPARMALVKGNGTNYALADTPGFITTVMLELA